MHNYSRLLPVAVLIFVLPASALADGISFAGRDMDFGPLRQDQQRAFLSLRDGTEHMLIAIDVSFENDDLEGLWIFPVPGTPDTVAVDLVDRFPVMRGINPLERARARLTNGLVAEVGLVVSPVGALLLFPTLGGRDMDTPHAIVTVEKHGLHADTVTAQSLDALAAYLAGRNVTLPAEELALFEPYLNNDHVLVVTSIASADQLREAFPDDERRRWGSGSHRWPALYVTFPADKLFYPMRPTAGYGDEYVRVSIATIGHARPVCDAAMLDRADVHHYVQDHTNPEALPAGMLPDGREGTRLHYTRVSFRCPARMFTSDMTFEPKNTRFSRFQLSMASPKLAGVPIVKFIILLIVTGAVCGRIVFGQWRRPAVYGLLGILSFPVVAYFTWRDIARNGRRIPRASAFAYAFLYLVLFIILDIATTLLLLAPLRY